MKNTFLSEENIFKKYKLHVLQINKMFRSIAE